MLSRRALLQVIGLGAAARQARAEDRSLGYADVGLRADTGSPRSECGVGALMSWAEALWAVTYNSHLEATGTGLGLYRIDETLRAERVHVHNGTHANRLVHKESDQAFVGPYAIDNRGNFRFIEAFRNHRLTATMRHLSDPASRVLMLTMEGLLFELEVDSLRARLLADLVKELGISKRPHFKGGFTGQGRAVVANNGFYAYGEEGAGLFEWDGKSWRTLSRKPHMECAGRQNMGNVVFATGWDEASVLFWALVDGAWQRYRLPKGSHTFEHAWQTEWTRIREVETERFLVDIHGMFYELQPVPFEGRIWGLSPICRHLRIIPDYCAFRGLLALGGNQTTPNNDNNPLGGQPQSGIWFGKTDDLWSWGKPAGWGGVWRQSGVEAGVPSDPFLMTGFENKVLHLVCHDRPGGSFRVEVDVLGNGAWQHYETLEVKRSYLYHVFPPGFSAHWVRLVPPASGVVSAQFFYT